MDLNVPLSCGLFKHAVSSSGFIVPNDKFICELWMCTDVRKRGAWFKCFGLFLYFNGRLKNPHNISGSFICLRKKFWTRYFSNVKQVCWLYGVTFGKVEMFQRLLIAVVNLIVCERGLMKWTIIGRSTHIFGSDIWWGLFLAPKRYEFVLNIA